MTSNPTAAQFINSLGVNVHLEYTDGKYASTTNVLSDLSYLGIAHVRDAVLNPGNQGQSSYDTLAAAGIKFDLFFQGVSLSSTLKLVDGLVARHPGSVTTIEGPNEINNFPVTYNGQSGNSAAIAYQNALYTAAHADASLKGVPVANFTSYPALAGSADYANFHSYPKGGVQPLATLTSDSSQEEVGEVGKPIIMTEGGYTTLTTANYFGGVDQATQAKLIVNMVLDNERAGVTSSYLFELLDAYADPANSDPNRHFGLFNLDNSPKLAATAIHNLTTILLTGADANAPASNLGYSISGLPAAGESMVVTKTATTHDLVIWNEMPVWNSTTGQEVSGVTSPVTVHLNTLSDVSVYDPLISGSAVKVLHGVQDVSLNLSDHALVLEVKPASTPTRHVALADSVTLGIDLDGDGRSDVLWRAQGGAVDEWISSKGQGSESLQQSGTIGSDWKIVGRGDFDGDGKEDVLWWNKSNTVSEWLSSQGSGSASNHVIGQVSTPSWQVAGVGDFDGDGKSDILWWNKDGTVAEWLSTQGAGVASYHSLGNVSQSSWKIAGVGDFDGDGKADVLWWNSSGTIGEWLSSAGSGVSSLHSIGVLSQSGWKVCGVGDFDGDGKSDIVMVSTSGQVGEWLSSHGTGSSSYQAIGSLAAGWSISGTGDYDGDGKSDLFLTNAAGQAGEWLSTQGGGPSSFVELGSIGQGSIVG